MELIISILFILSFIFYILRLPLLLSYLIAGLIVSYFIHFEEYFIHFVNNLAISILLFFIGFEFSFNKIHKHINSSFLNTFITFLLFLFIGTIFAFFISKDLKSSLIFALVIYPSSSLIVIKMLQITNRLASIETPFIIIALILEDLFIAILLGLIKGSYFHILNVFFVILAIFINFKFKVKIRKFVSFLTNLDRELFLITIFFAIIIADTILKSPIGAFILGILISDTYENFFEKQLSMIREIIFMAFFFLFGYGLKSILPLINFQYFFIAIFIFFIAILLKAIYFIQIQSFKIISRSIITLIPRGEFSIFAIYMLQNEELKIIASIFVILSIGGILLMVCIKG
ncbi:MAG: cation:proton antiporter [candidate division WOR-3 bacterium]